MHYLTDFSPVCSAAMVVFFFLVHFGSDVYAPYANHVYRQFRKTSREDRWPITISLRYRVRVIIFVTCIFVCVRIARKKRAPPFASLRGERTFIACNLR